MKSICLFLCVIIFAILGCKDNSTDSPIHDSNNNNELVKVRLDLHSGFAGKVVRINLNDDANYYSILSEAVSLAGPEAFFSTYLPRDQNRIIVFLNDPSNIHNYVRDTTTFSLGSKDKYFIGIRFTDKINLTIQDSSFFYL